MSKNSIIDRDIPQLGAGTLEEETNYNYNDEDNYNFDEGELDAFNAETFASTLENDEYDWEAEHDKLLMLETRDGSKSPPKLDDVPDLNENLKITSNISSMGNGEALGQRVQQPMPQRPQQQQQAPKLNEIMDLFKKNPVQAPPQPLPTRLPPGNVKTLEEIENELLNGSSNGVGKGVNNANGQSQNAQLNELPNLNQMNIQATLAHLQQQQQQQQQPLPNLPAGLTLAQMQALQVQQMASYINMMSLNNPATATAANPDRNNASPINQPKNDNMRITPEMLQYLSPQDQQMLLLKQQQMIEQHNINQILSSNLPQQYKQVLLSQIQRNIQSQLLQQHMAQQQQQQQQQQQLQQQQQRLLDAAKQQYELNQQQTAKAQSVLNQQQLNISNQTVQNENQASPSMSNMSNLNNSNLSSNSNRSFNNRRNDENRQRNAINAKRGYGDRLTGLMTDKEKNWIINVQMLQLQIDDPYKQDYYHTAWKKKQYSNQNPNQTDSKGSFNPLLHPNKHDPRNYKPITFENSLGKVTTSNFHHPRALIELDKASQDSDDKHKETKNICTILLEIEKMYELYLDIDEIEHNILKAPEDQRVALFHDRRAKVERLVTMLCSENFAHYLFVSKGKRLLGKCIPAFNPSQTKLILELIMQHLYIISKNNITLDDTYAQISYAIDTLKFTDLVDIVNQFVHLYTYQPIHIFTTIFVNKFGLTYLLKFISKSELVSQDDYEDDVKKIWSSYLTLVLNALLNITQQQQLLLNNNLKLQVYEVYNLNVKSMLDEFHINYDLWVKNEAKLKELFTLTYE